MNNLEVNKQKYLEKLHKEILTIMDEIDRICQEHHLRYYLMCGSCLGALRHKGFIPWDDDLDITMPRDDFDKFVSLVSGKTGEKQVLDERFYFRWITTEKEYSQDFAKVCIKGTVFKTHNGKADEKAGIYVDVFPLDPCEPYSKKIQRKSIIYRHFHSCLVLKGAEKGAMDWKIKHWPRNLISKCFSSRVIYKIMLYIIKPPKGLKTECQAFFCTPYPINRQVFPNSWHGEGRRVQFENRFYVCPAEAESVIKLIYGNNYMDIPPVNKRKTHYPIRIVFSDGEEMLFEKAKMRVKYNDIID